MKLVICAKMECPARLVGRAVPTAGAATKAALAGAGVADSTSRVATQAGEYLPEVLSQVRKLLGQLVQSRIG